MDSGVHWFSQWQCAYMQKGDVEIYNLLQKLYNQDFHNENSEKTAPSRNNLQAMKVWKDLVKLVNGHYQLDLP
jgi:hypothetical protein